MVENKEHEIEDFELEESEGFEELIKFTIPGFVGGLGLGIFLDYLGFQTNAIGQWLVRTLSGEGESILEGIYSLRRRIAGAAGEMAEAYGWGKLMGMVFPWIIDLISRLGGVNIYGVQGFYIPYFYALSDQIGANISGFVFLTKKEGSPSGALKRYFTHPVMLSSLAVILIAPIALLLARIVGFSPSTQTYTALETIAANLCWVPPVVGWISEKIRWQNGKDK